MLAPAGTPPAIIDKLNKAINEVVADKDVEQRFAAFAGEPLGGTPEDFARFIALDIAKWKAVSHASGIKIKQ